MSKPTLYLLDGMALVYRAYYALMSTRLKTKSGFPTGAVFGFANTLLKLMEQATPDYIAVAFDTKEKTFRHDSYPLYKAQRPPPPEDLIAQLPKIFQLVDGYGIRRLMLPGYEADDIIGTLARQHEMECEVFMVTPDKDFAQLVNESIKILKPSKEDDKFDLFGREEVKVRYGVYPEHFVPMLTLMGDSSDNVPGAVGIGPKTAAILINEYATIENLYAHLDALKPKTRDSLTTAREHLKLAEFLVTIKTDVPLDLDLETLRPA
ncbi:MAG: DNA polymerase I, partial [Rhizobacter sp.]|nr:DNA polymerase I [Chlorobiales bacterium]